MLWQMRKTKPLRPQPGPSSKSGNVAVAKGVGPISGGKYQFIKCINHYSLISFHFSFADSHNHSPRDSHDHSPTPGWTVLQFLDGFNFQSNPLHCFAVTDAPEMDIQCSIVDSGW